MAITLRHTHNIGNATEAYLQFAMLYSNPSGQRCIRCRPTSTGTLTRTQIPLVHHSLGQWKANTVPRGQFMESVQGGRVACLLRKVCAVLTQKLCDFF